MNSVYYPKIDETVFRQVLPNGLHLAVIPRPGFAKKLAYVVTDFGSVHTDFRLEGQEYHVPQGIAHYLEHKMFDLPGGRDASVEFASYGASSNAYTSYDMTAYYFSCTEHFEECLKLLLELVSTPCFTEESVEKERGIIDQEIDKNLDASDSVVFENLARVMYQKHPIRVPILGTHESIRRITPENLALCHRAFYAPGNMTLCVMGDVDPEKVSSIARQMLGDTPSPVGEKLRDWDEPLTCPQKEVRGIMDVAMPTFLLGFKCPAPGKGEEAIRQEFLADLAAEALFGESSRLYLQMYDSGIIDSSFGGGFETIDGCAMFLCEGDSYDAYAVRDAVLAAAREFPPLAQADFARMKRSAFGRRVKALDSFDATCSRLCTYGLADFDYFRFPEIYETLQKEDVEAFLKRTVRGENSCLSILDPVCKGEET